MIKAFLTFGMLLNNDADLRFAEPEKPSAGPVSALASFVHISADTNR